MRAKRAGFSLTELLVVMVIIIVLAGIMMYVYRKIY
jgi:prepilin-type N-terminal cleavage/methylation domain-containing protein